jgi:uncharacterized protein (DUF2236 family)
MLRTVGADDVERELERVRATAAGPLEGVFGPESLTWRLDREAAIFLGAGRAMLLQLAHPWVAAAIAEHSRTLTDPIGRFHRTFDIMFSLVFGTLDHALTSALRLHRRHGTINGVLPMAVGPFAAGSRYQANEVSALLWVHSTLVETALIAYELVLPALTAGERERYYAESRALAALFGIPASSVPPDWKAFAAYNAAMLDSDILSVNAVTCELAGCLLDGTGAWLGTPKWYRGLTVRLLPPRLRPAFGLPYGAAEQDATERALAWLRRIYPRVPERLRTVGPYQEAKARLAGRARPTLSVQMLNRLWIGRGRLTNL